MSLVPSFNSQTRRAWPGSEWTSIAHLVPGDPDLEGADGGCCPPTEEETAWSQQLLKSIPSLLCHGFPPRTRRWPHTVSCQRAGGEGTKAMPQPRIRGGVGGRGSFLPGDMAINKLLFSEKSFFSIFFCWVFFFFCSFYYFLLSFSLSPPPSPHPSPRNRL